MKTITDVGVKNLSAGIIEYAVKDFRSKTRRYLNKIVKHRANNPGETTRIKLYGHKYKNIYDLYTPVREDRSEINFFNGDWFRALVYEVGNYSGDAIIQAIRKQEFQEVVKTGLIFKKEYNLLFK